MDKKKLMLLIGALIIAIGTGLAARTVLSGSSTPDAAAVAPPVPQGPKVLVAQRALPVGTIVTQDSILFQQWPKEMVQDAYFIEGEADMSKLIGTVVRNPITAGQPVTQGSLVAPGDRGFLAAALGPGMRAITINVSQKTGVSGFIFPGDHVDLLLTQVVDAPGSREGNLKTTETVLRNLRVLATDQSTDTEIIDGRSIVKQSKTVTLEVTPRIAEKIQVAETIGSLSLSLRSIADNQSELERQIASGNVKVPSGASKLEEDRLLTQAMNKPIEGATSFVTGGDVSRFQRRTLPTAPVTVPVGMLGPNGKSPRAIPARVIPVIRVSRGKNTTEEPVGN